MRVKPAHLSIRREFAQTRRGSLIPIYVARYHGVLLGDWVYYVSDQFFFALPDGKILYREPVGKKLAFRKPQRRLNKRIALVKLADLRQATVTLMKRDLL